MFEDRKDAGDKLAVALSGYRGKAPLVLAIPRGGVEVGRRVADHLGADFSLIVSRKLPYPDSPEAGFGAVAEDGSTFIFKQAAAHLPETTVRRIIEEQRREILRRIQVLRDGGPLPEIAGRTVILIDDGIAMGSTMRASIMLCRNRDAGKVVVAVPVAGKSTADEIRKSVDDLIVLEQPPDFHAVAQVYRNWYDVTDEEVLELLKGGN